MNITAIILAAGSSTRLGKPKQLLQRNGRSLLRQAAETACASRASEVVVVLGYEASRMRGELRSLHLRVVENSRWKSGVSSSIIGGIASLSSMSDGAMLMVCDQPRLAVTHLDALINVFSQTGHPAVASGYADTVGVPAIFGRTLIPELLTLTGDTGAKEVLLRHASELAVVPWPVGSLDIDSEADLSALL